MKTSLFLPTLQHNTNYKDVVEAKNLMNSKHHSLYLGAIKYYYLAITTNYSCTKINFHTPKKFQQEYSSETL